MPSPSGSPRIRRACARARTLIAGISFSMRCAGHFWSSRHVVRGSFLLGARPSCPLGSSIGCGRMAPWTFGRCISASMALRCLLTCAYSTCPQSDVSSCSWPCGSMRIRVRRSSAREPSRSWPSFARSGRGLPVPSTYLAARAKGFDRPRPSFESGSPFRSRSRTLLVTSRYPYARCIGASTRSSG